MCLRHSLKENQFNATISLKDASKFFSMKTAQKNVSNLLHRNHVFSINTRRSKHIVYKKVGKIFGRGGVPKCL